MNIKDAADLINNADNILICAGAGMGVDSGLPDFRGNEGFWNAYPPYEDLGFGFTDMANPNWFKTNPEFAWGFYGHRLNLYRGTVPHKGFNILMNLVKQKDDYFVFTSNVDGQFQKAGFSDKKIVECHGSIHHLQCSDSCPDIWEAKDVNLKVDKKTMKAIGELPLCPKCNSVARPNILMFGDWNWISDRTDEQYGRINRWISNTKKFIIIEIGAGTAIPTVRAFSERLVKKYKSNLIRINIREPEVPYGNNIGIPSGALKTLEKIEKNIYLK